MVELLVVVAIIAILAALLLPSLQLAKEKGKATDCINNLHHIHTAFALFASDNDDYFPFTQGWWRYLGNAGYVGTGEIHGGVTTPGPSGWAYSERRWPVFRCAGEKGAIFNTPDPNCKQPNPLTTGFDSDTDHCSYAMWFSINWYHYNPYTPTMKPRKGFLTELERIDCPGGRSAAPFIIDKCAPYFGWVINCIEWNIDNADPYAGSGCGGGCYYAFRHPGGRANVLYLDGHVGTMQHANVTGKPNWVNVWNSEPPEI